MRHPTRELYGELQTAFAHFNEHLFGNALKPALITLVRKSRTRGYCSLNRFVAAGSEEAAQPEFVNEIALNPAYFAVRSIMETLSTLVHEMCHQWQFELGQPPRSGYHDTEWASKMLEVGLCPSDTGEPGGKRVGQKVTHYIIRGGRFHLACEELLTRDFTLSWLDRFPDERPRGSLVLYPHPDEVQERRQALVDVLVEKGMGQDEVKSAIAELEKQSRVADIGQTPDGSTCIAMKILDGKVLESLQNAGALSGLGDLEDDLGDVVDALKAVSSTDDDEGETDGPAGAAVITTLPAGGLGPAQSMQNVRVTELQLLRNIAVAKPVNPGVDLPKPKAEGEKKTDRSNRVKYICTSCHTAIWGKPNIRILCGNPVHDETVVMLPQEPVLREPPTSKVKPEDEAMAGIETLKFPSSGSRKPAARPLDAELERLVAAPGGLQVDGKPLKKRISQEEPFLLSRLNLTLTGGESPVYGSCEVIRIDARKMEEQDENLHELLMGTGIGDMLLAGWQGGIALGDDEGDAGGAGEAGFVKAMGGRGDSILKGRDHLVLLHALSVPGEPARELEVVMRLLPSYATSKSAVVVHARDSGQVSLLGRLGFKAVENGFMVLPLQDRAWMSRKAQEGGQKDAA